MAQLIPGDASLVVTRLLILVVWGVTPLCWLVVVTLGVRHALERYASYALDARLWRIVTAHAPCFVTSVLEWWLSPTWRWARVGFYAYCAVEAAFSLYHVHLSRKIQRPGPRPLYGRRFLRDVFAQALQAGLKPTDTYASAVASAVAPRSNGEPAQPARLDETTAPTNVRQRLGRLRAASFVPQFVSTPVAADDARAVKFQQDQARWFFGTPAEHITRRDVMHWLAWSLFASHLETLEAERDAHARLSPEAADESTVESATPSAWSSPAPLSAGGFAGPTPEWGTVEQEDVRGVRAKEGEWDPTTGDRLGFLEYCLELLETRQGRSYPEHAPEHKKSRADARKLLVPAKASGGPRVRMMRLTIDPVRTRTRPLVCYLVTNTLSYLTIRRAMRGGFELCHQGRLPYLYRAAPSPRADADATPLIVLHGLGIGLAQYASLVSFFLRSETFAHRPIVILLQPNISQTILSAHFLQPFGHHETTSAFRRILALRGWTSIDVLSHSYGSLVHSWLIKSLGTQVRRSCFVDPVCFQLWVPYVCANFIYKRATTPIQLLMRYFVARELGTANTLCRYFDWSSNILWPNEIDRLQNPKFTRFYLAEQDAILNAKDTLDYLVESGCPRENIHYGRAKAHGEMLMHGGDEFANIVDWLSLDV